MRMVSNTLADLESFAADRCATAERDGYAGRHALLSRVAGPSASEARTQSGVPASGAGRLVAPVP